MQSKVRIEKHLKMKQGPTLLPILFSFILEFVFRNIQETNLELSMNVHQVLAFADDASIIANDIIEMQICY